MDIGEVSLTTRRALLAVAFALLVAGIVQRMLLTVGTTIPLITVEPSRLIEWGALLMIFAIGLLLREIVKALEKA